MSLIYKLLQLGSDKIKRVLVKYSDVEYGIMNWPIRSAHRIVKLHICQIPFTHPDRELQEFQHSTGEKENCKASHTPYKIYKRSILFKSPNNIFMSNA